MLILMVPSQKFEKGDETKTIYERFFGLLLPQKKLLADIFFASLLYTLLGILGAFYFKTLLDDILPASSVKTLHILSVGVILLNLFVVALAAIRSQLLLYLSQKLDIALLLGYYSHVLQLPMNFFGTRKVGEIISRFQDASKVRDAISGVTLTMMIDTVMALAGGIILYFQNSTLFLITVIIVILYGTLVLAFNKRYKKLNQRQMEDNAQLTSYLVESLNGIQTVKAFNGEHKVNVETEFRFIKLLKSIFRLGSASNVQETLKTAIELVGGVVILWVGAYSAINGNITIGGLVVFNSLLAYFLGPVKNLINLQPMMQTAVVAADRLGEILDLDNEKEASGEGKLSPQTLKEDIIFNGVTFRYGTRQTVLDGLNIHIKVGERVAFVGESGAGKTTIAKLLLRFYALEKGEISIGATAINDIKFEVLREKIAYIPQETFLFSGSIFENLTFGMEEPDMELVIEAAKMAQANEFINSLPLRYETRLEENGANLSGGQRQRLALARAMLKRPDILLLDEATSNLDSVTEHAIEQTINSYSKGITTLIIAHRLSTIRRCDKIFVIKGGQVVGSGSHEALLAQGGYYCNLLFAVGGC